MMERIVKGTICLCELEQPAPVLVFWACLFVDFFTDFPHQHFPSCYRRSQVSFTTVDALDPHALVFWGPVESPSYQHRLTMWRSLRLLQEEKRTFFQTRPHIPW